MATIKIDGKDYNTDTLSDDAKKQVAALQVIDGEIRRLKLQLGIANTARGVHVQFLKAALPANKSKGK